MLTTVIHVEVKADSTILTDLEEIELAGRTVGTEDKSNTVPAGDLHLHLKGEVAEVASIRGAGDKEMRVWSTHMVRLSTEGTRTRATAPFIPTVALAIITQR